MLFHICGSGSILEAYGIPNEWICAEMKIDKRLDEFSHNNVDVHKCNRENKRKRRRTDSESTC